VSFRRAVIEFAKVLEAAGYSRDVAHRRAEATAARALSDRQRQRLEARRG